MRQLGTSILPPKDRLINELNYHEREQAILQQDFHLDDWASEADCRRCDWHEREADKLSRVLDALYPGWDAEPSSPKESFWTPSPTARAGVI